MFCSGHEILSEMLLNVLWIRFVYLRSLDVSPKVPTQHGYIFKSLKSRSLLLVIGAKDLPSTTELDPRAPKFSTEITTSEFLSAVCFCASHMYDSESQPACVSLTSV